MINRVLIRIKVVQLLYSYFLVQNNFTVQSQPSAPTKEKRFAYALYLDYLYLMVRIADTIQRRGAGYPLADTRFIKRLNADNIIKSLRVRYPGSEFVLEPAVAPIAEKLKDSAIYKNFLKNPSDDTRIWPLIFDNFIAVDKEIATIAEGIENYSLRGLDRAKEMIRETFTEFNSSQDNLTDTLKDLKTSLDKARELYFRLLMLPVELTYQREVDLDERRHRYIKTDEDLNPNPKFIDNELVKLLNDNQEIRDFAEDNKISWVEQDRPLVKHLLKKIIESDIYADYMASSVSDLREDCEFWRNVMRYIVFTDEEFLESLETKSVFWNDDIDIMGDFVLKTFRRFEETAEAGADTADSVLPMFKDEEDAAFGRDLFEATVKNRDKYRGYIDDMLNTHQWEADRLAYMDVVIMITALAEIFRFPKIPLVASINEYIEIAKAYSTPKSGGFIHGLLAAVITNLKEKGILHK